MAFNQFRRTEDCRYEILNFMLINFMLATNMSTCPRGAIRRRCASTSIPRRPLTPSLTRSFPPNARGSSGTATSRASGLVSPPLAIRKPGPSAPYRNIIDKRILFPGSANAASPT